VNGNQSRFSELAVPDCEDSRCQINVVNLQSDGFAETQSRYGEKTEEAIVRRPRQVMSPLPHHGKPVRVRQVCGQVANEKGFTWPSTLRLTKRNQNRATDAFEQLTKSDDEGRFAFKNIPAGEYELRVTATGMREVFVPVLVDLRRPQGDDNCARPIDLKLDFLPEPCVSPELRKAPR